MAEEDQKENKRKKLIEDIEKARKEVEEGKIYTWEEVKEELDL